MAKISQFVTDPKAGAYCRITLDNGEKIVINHDKGGFKGGSVSIERLELMGFSYLKTCQSVAEVKARCAALMAAHRPGGA